MIPGTAENLLFGEFAYRAPRGWFVAADALYVDEQFGDNANIVVIDDYTLTNFRFGYDVELGSPAGSPVAVRRRQQLDRRNLYGERPDQRRGRIATSSRARDVTAYAGVTLDWKFR